jgi:sentrin-specific protease 8
MDPPRAASAAGEDGNERVLSYGDVVLLRSDLAILRGRHFLNDRIIAFYLAHLSSAFGANDDDGADLLLLPPSIPYLLSNLPDPDSVAMVAEPIRLASRRLVLLPVNDNPDASLAEGGSHWTLLVLDATAGASRPRFVHHDSLGFVNVPAACCLADALRPLLPDADNGAPLVEGPTPMQVNGHDCGVYVLAVARAICSWWRDRRGQQQDKGTDWFDTVKNEVDAASVGAMRAEMLHLIARLIQEKEDEAKKKNMDREVGKED